MMITMLFPKEERLLLLGAGIIILLCIPVSVLSLISSSLTLSNYGQISIPGREYPSSNFTYRIFRNSTSTYRINSKGFVDDHYGDPAVVINNAMSNCSTLGGGSVFLYKDTYLTNGTIGKAGMISAGYLNNVYLDLDGSTIRKTGGSGTLFQLWNYWAGAGTINFTLTSSNGTAYLDGDSMFGCIFIGAIHNSTFSNIQFQNGNGDGLNARQLRNDAFVNVTGYNWAGNTDGKGIIGSDIQYCNFTNINLDGTNNQHCRAGFELEDWNSNANWNGSYFNTVTGLWVHNVWRDGIYLNSGGTGFGVYNNTFTNCTIENNWGSGFDAIKFRPAQNNTCTDIIIRNFTNAVTTGTSYDGSEIPGNCSGNYVQATIYNCTETSLILCSDGNNQNVTDNFFNLTVQYGKGLYCSQGTNSPIQNNTVYMSFTDCSWGVQLDQGLMHNNSFYLNFTRCGSAGKSDIYHNVVWTQITNNTFYVYATSGNPNGLYDFTNGTQGNIVVYPYFH